jgi:hypothetical protein
MRGVIFNQQLRKKPVNSFFLDNSYKVSVGVFNANNDLLKTLITNETKASGQYSLSDFPWDGLDENGVNVTSSADHIKVIANNIADIWEGVIGNTSSSFIGGSVHREYDNFTDMLIFNNEAYWSTDYTEAWGSVTKSSLLSMNSKSVIMAKNVQQATNRIATDGVRLYMAGRKAFEENVSYIQAATFANLGNFNNFQAFQGETVQIFGSTYKVANIVTSALKPRVTGLAVQVAGDNLFVARERINSLQILHKTTGVLRQDLTLTKPKHCKVDVNGNLWMVVNENLIKYTVNATTGAITASGFSINGFRDVQAVGLNSDSSIVTVADIDINGNHKVFAYNTTTGVEVWTIGRNENYAQNPNVYNDKFLFTSKWDEVVSANYLKDGNLYTFTTFQPDGSLWIGDRGNDRVLKFNPSRVYEDKIMWLPAVYSCNVDPNNTTRIFGGFREFSVDYSKTLEAGNVNNAWSYVRNWGESINTFQGFDDLGDVTTLSNNRTYALLNVGGGIRQIVELENNTGVRLTSVQTNGNYPKANLKSDGKIARVAASQDGLSQTIFSKSITGFDVNNNPIVSNEEAVITYLIENNLKIGGPHTHIGEKTIGGIIPVFNGGKESGFHLGGVKEGNNGFKFRTSKSVIPLAGSPFPKNGDYDNRAGVEYAGNIALAIDKYIIWGYNGEFWEGGQTNRYNMYHESGLFLHHFGEDSKAGLGQAIYGMAGNAFSPRVVKHNNDIILWHNDESYHAGLHKWKIGNLNSIQEYILPLT